MTGPDTPSWFTTPAPDDPLPRRHNNNTTTAPPPGREPINPGPDLIEVRTADLRRRAIDRLVDMNIKQADAAWQRRRRDPLEPHALALLYVQPDPSGLPPYWQRLTAATRLWLQDDHGFDVHQRMFRFYHDVAAEIRSGVDVRDYADRRDEAMTDDAVYVGVGVSSLDTSTGAWRDVVATASTVTTDTRPARLWGRAALADPPPPAARMRVEDHRDIPGSFRIILTDATVIAGERRGRPDYDHRIIHATETLNFAPYNSPYPWALVPREELHANPEHTEVLRWMGQLNDLCCQADAARLDARRQRRQPPQAHR